jgi:hypothetical protein
MHGLSLRRAGVTLACVLGALALVPAAHAATFGAPVVVTDQDLSEPGIDAAPDGTLYVNAPDGLLSNLPGSPSPVFRSGDGGATWTETPFSLRANLPGGGDSDISIDPTTGHLAMTDLWLGSSTVSASTDKGQTWTANPLQGVVVQDRQWVAAAGNNVVYHLTHQIPSGLIVSKSVDGGVTYPLHVVAATPVDQTGCVCPPGTLIAQGGSLPAGLADKVGFVYATSTGTVKFAGSSNGGLTWSNVVVGGDGTGDTEQAFPVVANAGGGSLVAVWTTVENGRSSIQLASSKNWGATWSATQTLVSAGTSIYPWVDARGSKVVVSLFHTDAVGEPSTVGAGSTWFESYLESLDGGTTFSALQSADPTPAKTGPICTAGINCSGDRQLGDFQSIALDPAGRANLAWARVKSGSDTEIRFVRTQ